MSLYGHGRPTTPHLDAWAAGARVFEDCVSPSSWTVPSHASMFTGLLPSQHGAGADRPWLDDRHATLAEILAASGYQTYLYSANPHVSTQDNLQQGFERQEHPWDAERRDRAFAIVRDKVEGDASSELGSVLQRRQVSSWAIKAAGALAQESLESWLDDRDRSRPYFAFLNYMEAHRPYIPPRKYRAQVMAADEVARSYGVDRAWLPMWRYTFGLADYSAEDLALTRATYDATLAELDALFDALIASLEARGDLDDTIVVLTSDHGELLGEHHMLDHQFSLHRPLLRVPLVIHHPDRVDPGRDRRPVTTLDLFATLLELTGVAVPETDGLQSASLLQPADERVRLAEYPSALTDPFSAVRRAHPEWDPGPWKRGLRAVHAGPHKLIWAEDGRHELYDLAADPGERENLIDRQPELAERLHGELERQLASLGAPAQTDGPVPELTEEQRRMLEGLGYATPAAEDSAAPELANTEGGDAVAP